MLSSSLRRNILADPLVDLAMHARQSHPVPMIRLKPLPDDVAILDQSYGSQRQITDKGKSSLKNIRIIIDTNNLYETLQ